MKKRLLILTTLLVAMAAGASAAIKADTYYLTGSIASWGINEDYELVEVEAGLYKCAGVAITTSDLIKVVKSNSAGSGIGSWYPDGMDNNQKVTEDGTYTVYFRPAGDGTEADGYTYIPHGSDADAHGCTNGGYMFKFVETPVAAGTYYLYNPYSGKFLSRGSAGGTRAVADDYGFPINVTFDSEGAYTLDNYDGTGAYGDDYWMYADCKGTRVRTFTLEAVGDGYYLHNTSRNTEDNRMFVYMKEDADKYAIAGNADADNTETLDQAVWQFLTPAQRDKMVADSKAEAEATAIAAAGMTGSVFDADGEAGELTFKTGSAWTFTATRGGSALASNDYGTEMYQGCGNFTQTVENLESGLYKVSIQALYRDGANAAMAAAYNEGYALGVAYMQANDSKVLVKAWAEDRSDDNTPNNVAEFAESVSEGNYVSETYAYVGSDGTLSLTVNVPSNAGFGWFQGDNVTYQKMKEHVNIPYGIKILGKEIDSSNCGDFTVEGLTGTVTYDPDSKTLTLTDVTIHNEGETNCIRNEEVDGLTINVVSDSKLTSKSNGWGGHLYKEGYYYNG